MIHRQNRLIKKMLQWHTKQKANGHLIMSRDKIDFVYALLIHIKTNPL